MAQAQESCVFITYTGSYVCPYEYIVTHDLFHFPEQIFILPLSYETSLTWSARTAPVELLWGAGAGCAGSAKYVDCEDSRLERHLRSSSAPSPPLHTHCEYPASRRLSLGPKLAFPTKNPSRLISTGAPVQFDHTIILWWILYHTHFIVLTSLSIFVRTIPLQNFSHTIYKCPGAKLRASG